MPPTMSTSRVPIGGGAVGGSTSMKSGSGKDSKTFQVSGGGGRSRGGPQQKVSGVRGIDGVRVGGRPGVKAAPVNDGTGLKGTIKSGKGISSKPQAEAPTQGRY